MQIFDVFCQVKETVDGDTFIAIIHAPVAEIEKDDLLAEGASVDQVLFLNPPAEQQMRVVLYEPMDIIQQKLRVDKILVEIGEEVS